MARQTTILRDFRCFVCFVVNSAVTTYNAALNKTAYQSSVYSLRGKLPLSAHLANDGSRETNVYRCAHSERDTNPWWAVDLGRPTEVYAVNFTNREGCCGMNKIQDYVQFIFSIKICSRWNHIIHLHCYKIQLDSVSRYGCCKRRNCSLKQQMSKIYPQIQRTD